MVFSSLTFLFIYFPITLMVMKLSPLKYRNFCLLVLSLLFYSYGEPKYIIIMLVSCIVDYFNGYMVDKYRDNKRIAKRFVIFSIVFNLGLLGFFKYYDFLVSILNSIGINIFSPLNISLPIGISFYTFQTMSYPIDVYRNDAKVQKNLVNFSCYVTMFFQLIAGPIVRYKDIAAQLDHRIENENGFYNGIKRFVCGLAKKVILANNMGLIFEQINSLNNENISLLLAWLGIICFALQIYFDFSGYSDMAIGLASMFGFDLLENFNYPYIASSITDFWRRWHISLSSWFRDYVYIPLGGNRKGLYRQCINIMIVWLLTGLWHGASFNFILWGLYYGLILIFEKVIGLKMLKKIPVVFRHIYALILILIGWVIFNFTDFDMMINYFKLMFCNPVIIDDIALYFIRDNIILIIISIVACLPVRLSRLNPFVINKKFEYLMPLIILGTLIICVAFICESSYNPFLYFRF
ncbi:MAG: MBOAT family O-acyltransferase [Erysipelotrichaceae bacterium]|nr:MBOAT family O-acyltransferase [Erysipelotrichaceae bacterium]